LSPPYLPLVVKLVANILLVVKLVVKLVAPSTFQPPGPPSSSAYTPLSALAASPPAGRPQRERGRREGGTGREGDSLGFREEEGEREIVFFGSHAINDVTD
jgi:hypothetical protein